jgi:hypothetical protein
MLFIASDTGECHSRAEIERLRAHLAASATATEALESWCRPRGIGSGPIRTEVLAQAGVSNKERGIGWRRVRLLRGEAFLSLAEIRFRSEAMTPAMLESLAAGAMPFGAVVKDLEPQRTTTYWFDRPLTGQRDDDVILFLHATVLDKSGRALARVREAYQRLLIEPATAPRSPHRRV